MSQSCVEVTDSSFQTEVLQSALPVLVDFWAPWCAPCRMVGPVVEELATEFAGRVKVAKVNVDENQNTAAQFNVRGIPTLLFLKNGAVVDQVVGAASKKILTGKLTALLT